MEFIKTEDMTKFTELGYTLTEEFKPNKLGTTYEIVVTDKDGKEVTRSSSAYANLSGRGYSMSGVQHSIAEKLNDIINGDVTFEPKEDIDTDFLYNLVNWGYISDYGYDKDGTMTIIFDSWQQLEGREDRQTGEIRPSVYAKFVRLAEEGKLKPSINYTLAHVDTAFSDEYAVCNRCGRVFSKEWDGLNYIETTGELLCNDCTNESDEAIDYLVDEAKDDFKKALPVMISEDKLEELGYERLSEEDFEEGWNGSTVAPSIMAELCQKYEGFAKLTCVGQWGCSYITFFPSNLVAEAHTELKEVAGYEVS